MSIETIDYRGYKIEVNNDVPACDPREEDNLGTMVCFHNRYRLGDQETGLSKDDVKDIIRNTDEYISLPLYLYDHSGITMNTSGFTCKWDSGMVGIIFISKAEVREQYGWKNLTKPRITQIETYLRNEVKTYDYFITGECYGYNIINKEGEDIGESCGGFLGSNHEESGLLEYAKNAIDCDIKREEKNGIQMELELEV